MKDIEKNITAALKSDPELAFSTSDDELFKRAAITANNQQGTKDLVGLGLASIWIVFVSLFMKILKPIFKQMTINSTTKNINTAIFNSTSINTTNNETK